MTTSLPNLRFGYLNRSLQASRSSSPAAKNDCLSERSMKTVLSGDEANGASQSTPPSPQNLEWTLLPQSVVCEEEGSGTVCRVRLPANSGQRVHKIHLTRSTRIEPKASLSKSAHKPPSIPTHRREKQEDHIHVTESDFRRCGSDLKLLRECQLHPKTLSEPELQLQPDTPLDLSFRSAFELRCREKNEILDPWRNHSSEFAGWLAGVPCSLLSVSPESLDLPDVFAPSSASTRASSAQSSPTESERGAPRSASGLTFRKRMSRNRSSQPDVRRRSDGRRSPSHSHVSGRSGHECRIDDAVVSQATSKYTSPIQPLSLEADPPADDSQRRYGSAADSRFVRHLDPRMAGAGAESFVLWFSVDPDSGEVCFYPSAAAKRLELGYRNGRSSVPLVGLGDRVDGVIVYFGDGGIRSARIRGASKSSCSSGTSSTSGFVEKSWSGCWRHAARVVATSSWHDLCVNVIWDTSVCQWRLAGDTKCSSGATVVTRRVRLTGDELVPPPSPTLPPARGDRRICFVSPAFANP